jgi:hypothetical protein
MACICNNAALRRLLADAEGFAAVDRRVAEAGGGIAFSADHLRGSAEDYSDMALRIRHMLDGEPRENY